MDARQYDDERAETGGFGAGAGKVQARAPADLARGRGTPRGGRAGAAGTGCWRRQTGLPPFPVTASPS